MFFSGVKLTDINNGTFLKSVFKNGDRIKLVQTSPQFTIESNGSYYSNGTLRTGIEKTISQNGFLIIEKSFENGAIDYVEYFQNLNQGLQPKFNYLNTINGYNQAITDLEYLIGQ